VKWANYSAFNCTWEAERNLSFDIFKCPSTPPPGLTDAKDEFLLAYHSRLCQRTSNHLHHEIFRYVFNGKGIINDNGITLFSKEDFSLFNLPENWDKIIYTDKGERRQIDFPVSLKPVLRWSKRQYVCSDGKLTDAPRMPVELLKVILLLTDFDVFVLEK
jgi:hypothetical protein